MKTNPFLFTLCLGATLLIGCTKKESPPAEEKKSDEPESRIHHGTNGESIIKLDAATQKLMGLQTEALAATELAPEVKGFGRVIDPAALATAFADFTSTVATAVASQKELARTKVLAAQNNASTRVVETAEASASRDLALEAAAKARLLAAAGKPMSERNDLATLIQTLTTGTSALLRIDLPASENLKSEPAGARILPLDENAPSSKAKFIGAAPAVDPQTQAQGFLFLVETNTASLVPGAAVTGFLQFPGASQTGVIVPRDAVVRFNGATWIYLQTAEDEFSRVPVVLGHPLTGGWFVSAGLPPQEKIVTVGGQQLLSEELKGQIGGD